MSDCKPSVHTQPVNKRVRSFLHYPSHLTGFKFSMLALRWAISSKALDKRSAFMVLSALPGVGDRLAKKITDHFGDEQAALDSLGAVTLLAWLKLMASHQSVRFSLARLVAGDSGSFLATKEAEQLHKDILNHIQNYASAPATRQRMQLLMPVEDPSSRRQKSTACHALCRQPSETHGTTSHPSSRALDKPATVLTGTSALSSVRTRWTR